jgi:glyoxylase-like metal-dependent hydrolase (beta-lactamase superfamily II)
MTAEKISPPTVEVLLQGFGVTTNQGHPAFCAVFLIEGPDASGRHTRVLVDPAHVGRRPVLWEALARRGLTAGDIDIVALTHAHWDHIQNIDVFEHAPLLVHKLERRYAHKPHKHDWATPKWTGLVLEQSDIREVEDGSKIIPGVTVIDMPGHSVGSIGIAVETAGGMSVITGDALHYAYVATSRENPLVFWNAEQATRSIDRAVALADILYPGHDQPFRLTKKGEIEYVEAFSMTVTGLWPGRPGLELLKDAPRTVWIMPGIEEQRLGEG